MTSTPSFTPLPSSMPSIGSPFRVMVLEIICEERPHDPPTPAEARIILDLSRAGKRLMGFCRTNLFKRLESSGQAFIQSIERHILRNFVYLHAIEAGLPLPIGTQDASLLDARFTDVERDLFTDEEEDNEEASNGSRWQDAARDGSTIPRTGGRSLRAVRGSLEAAVSLAYRRRASCRSSRRTSKPTSASCSASSIDVANGTLRAMRSWPSSPNWSRRNTRVARSSCSRSLPTLFEYLVSRTRESRRSAHLGRHRGFGRPDETGLAVQP